MILDEILAFKRLEVSEARDRLPLDRLQTRLAGMPAPRGFARALREKGAAGTAIIAEVKKGSPSKGVIRPDFDPERIALRYEKGGAACLSVLTDRKFFLGDLAYLPRIAARVELPLLRKDFIIDPYQIVEARVHRADAVLLIVAALDFPALHSLTLQAQDLGMDVLVEVHDEAELETALRLPVELIGINNRDLRTFQTDLGVTERLMARMPGNRLAVSESGIGDRRDVRQLLKAGAGAFLIGESLMREPDIESKLKSLLND